MTLAVETSCDETSLALTQGKKIIKVLTASQIKLHQPHGGVVPRLAARAHQKNLPLLFKKLVKNDTKINSIAVTVGPGLAPALGEGIDFAKQVAKKHSLPLIPVSHLLAHLVTPIFDQKVVFPLVSLIVSGGHTELVLTTSYRRFSHTLLGQTLDDAAGEALDKIGRLLGLSYPAGPQLEKLAEKGNSSQFKFPLPLRQSSKTTLNFSFSGLKTAAARALFAGETSKTNFAASFQKAVVDHLLFMVQRS
jgi:N6-L-threonylcarbamoyladenine synthase